MGFAGIKDIVNAEPTKNFGYWGRNALGGTVTNTWYDYSSSSNNSANGAGGGTSRPKYYWDAPPLQATACAFSTDGGIYHGPNVSPKQKIIRNITTWATNNIAPMPMNHILCDYLLYYPSIDETVLTVQTMDNTTTIPRYTTGEGVKIMAISLTSVTRLGGKSFTINYTNSSGVAGRVTNTVFMLGSTITLSVGNIMTSNAPLSSNVSNSPFITLQGNDTGVRSIQSVTMDSTDLGLFALVLVKPLCSWNVCDINTVTENEYTYELPQMPTVLDDAHLCFLGIGQSNQGSQISRGYITTIFN